MLRCDVAGPDGAEKCRSRAGAVEATDCGAQSDQTRGVCDGTTYNRRTLRSRFHTNPISCRASFLWDVAWKLDLVAICLSGNPGQIFCPLCLSLNFCKVGVLLPEGGSGHFGHVDKSIDAGHGSIFAESRIQRYATGRPSIQPVDSRL